jgi:hypothetical protein
VSLAALRADLAQAAATVDGLVGYDYTPASPTTPCVVFEPEEVDLQGAFRRGQQVWRMSAFVLVAPTDAEGSTRAVDAFFDNSANDLQSAFESVPGVSAVAADRWGEYPMRDGQTFVGCRFVLQIRKSGKE